MKSHRLGESTVAARFRRRASEKPLPKPARECLTLGDPTDCLLDAYDCVAQRAYDNFLASGSLPGRELEDWLRAERQLLLNFPIDIQETDNFVYALASVPEASAARISIGIESQWMVIVVRQPPAPMRPALADEPPEENKPDARPSTNASPGQRRAKSVCVKGLPCAVDSARSIAVLADGVLGIRMAKRHPGA
jgi:HSP20 family molecular chaperone IbpA